MNLTADYFCGKCAGGFGAVKFCFEFRFEFGANLSQNITCEVKFCDIIIRKISVEFDY